MCIKAKFLILLLLMLVTSTACDVLPSWIYDPDLPSETVTASPPTLEVVATATAIDALRVTRQEVAVLATREAALATPALATVSGEETCQDANTGSSMTYQEALDIAQRGSCGQEGVLQLAHFCNSSTGTWWLALETDRTECNPACVVDVNSRSAQVNWRCSGLDAAGETPQPTAQPTEVTEAPARDRFYGWQGVIYRQPPGSLVEYRLLRDDGQWFNLATRSSEIRQAFASAAWEAGGVTLTGEVGDTPGLIYVDALLLRDENNREVRDMTPFAMPSTSSQLASDIGGYYSAWSAVDGESDLPWCEGVAGPGAGEWIQLDFSAPVEVSEIRLTNGFDSSGYLYDLNNRVQTFSLYLDYEYLGAWNLTDSRGEQSYTLASDVVPGTVTTSIRLVIVDTFPGWEFDDTCIAEITVWGRPAE